MMHHNFSWHCDYLDLLFSITVVMVFFYLRR